MICIIIIVIVVITFIVIVRFVVIISIVIRIVNVTLSVAIFGEIKWFKFLVIGVV